MEFICQHCGKLTKGLPYRVTSEEAGEILLEMIVCYSCSEQAKSLGLHVEKINQVGAADHNRENTSR
jgi:ribosome-binding protein aMBF1 (putative translation factor)